MSCAPPPPPPLPGTNGAPSMMSYKDQRQQQQLSDPIQEQLYANLPSKLSSAMNKDKKPFSYTLGAPGENGVLDLNQIKSPRMRRRLQANLKGDEDPRNEIITSSPQQQQQQSLNCYSDPNYFDSSNYNQGSPNNYYSSPEVMSMMSGQGQVGSNGSRSSPSPAAGGVPTQFKIPPPPSKSVRDLEKQDYYGGDPGQPYYHVNYPGKQQPQQQLSKLNTNINNNNYENQIDEQLSGLYKSLNTTDGNNNQPIMKNHNASPKPFSSPKAPFEVVKPSFTPVQSPLSLPNGTDTPNFASAINANNQLNQLNQGQGFDEYGEVFPRPPPPQMSLIGDQQQQQQQQQMYQQNQEPIKRSKSPLVANPPIAYMPTLQEQWQAKKEGRSPSPCPVQVQPQQPMYQRQESYDRKMADIRESGTRYLPENPQLAYMPTLQEQWEAKKMNQQQQTPSRTPIKVVEADEEKLEPIQSKSFKILQRLTSGFEEELEAFKQASEPSSASTPNGQTRQQPQFTPMNDQHASASPSNQQQRTKSPIVENPPTVYMPTLQEQWLAKKMAKEQQQQQQPRMQSQQQQQAPSRPAPPTPQRQTSTNSYPQPFFQQSPIEQQSQLFQGSQQSQHQQQQSRQTASSMSSSGSRVNQEFIIPIRVEPRSGGAAGGQGQQGQGQQWSQSESAFNNFNSVRLLTGEDPFFSSPNNFSLPSSYNLFTPTGTQGTDF